MRINHEAIYQVLYIQGRGALKRELSACLQSGRALRLLRERARNRGKAFIADALMISDRPPRLATGQFRVIGRETSFSVSAVR